MVKPKPPPLTKTRVNNIPAELKQDASWVLWKYIPRKDEKTGKVDYTKPPFQPHNPKRHAKSDDPKTWSNFKTALDAAHKNEMGIGIPLRNGLAAADLDHCILKGRDGKRRMEEWAREIIKEFASYTEISPSGEGVRILFWGRLPGSSENPGRRYRKGNIELYDDSTNRYVTITGDHLPGTPKTIKKRPSQFEAVYKKVFSNNDKKSSTTSTKPTALRSPPLFDKEVLAKIRRSKNSQKFNLLWDGGKAANHPSDSEADEALLIMLGFYTQDPAQLERLFKQSPRADLPKGRTTRGERQDYLDRTIKKALSKVTVVWQPGRLETPPPSLAEYLKEHPGTTADQLLKTEFPPPRWAVQDLLPQGLSILGGRPKMGKSIMALNICAAITTGGRALNHFDLQQGEVLYISFEDGYRRLKNRIKTCLYGFTQNGLDGLHIFTEWPRAGQGGLNLLSEFAKEHPNLRLIIVDPLAKFRALSNRSYEYSYSGDYKELGDLKHIADEHNLAILIIHHLRKTPAQDPFDELSGTVAISGAPDHNMILKRSRGEADGELWVSSRDYKDGKHALNFDSEILTWTYMGDGNLHTLGPEQDKIIELLETEGPMRMKDIAETLDKDYNTIKQLIFRMRKMGRVTRAPGHKYKAIPFTVDQDLNTGEGGVCVKT